MQSSYPLTDTRGDFTNIIGAAENGQLLIAYSTGNISCDVTTCYSIHGQTQQKTAIMIAAQNGHLETIKKLIQNGANIHMKDEVRQ